MRNLLWAVCAAMPLAAADPLTLRDAVRTALEKHPAIEASVSRSRAAESRIDEARAGYLPRVGYAESWTRSDNPVFVFSSLLTQHQFSESNFRIGPLNGPDFLNNFQSQVTVDQTVYDWGATRARVNSADLARNISREDERRVAMNLMARVVRAYYNAILADASLGVARDALKSAKADLERAEAIRGAGMSTDADLLSIRVHMAGVREQEIRRGYDAQVARAALNEALGLPLDTEHTLATPLIATAGQPGDGAVSAAKNRPELKQLELALRVAEEQRSAARAARLPQFALRGAFEANRQEFIRKGGANWLVAASMRWNVFDGFSTRARIAEAEADLRTAEARRREASQGVELEVLKARTDLLAAQERIAVAAAAVAEAEESLRITKNRYNNGLSTVTDLLRNETALADARTRRLAAIHDQRLAAAHLELALGTLSMDSEILQ